MNTTPDNRGDDREHEAPGSFDPSAVLREMVNGWQLPSGSQPPADESCPVVPDDPRFTLPELADQEAMGYRAWGTTVGDFLARWMEELASLVRWTKATSPEEHEARIELWDEWRRERWESAGFEKGLEAARNQCRGGKALDD